MFLTAEQIQTLTGTKQRRRQIQWLTSNGWRFTLDLRDRPVVASAEMHRQLVSEDAQPTPCAIQWQHVA